MIHKMGLKQSKRSKVERNIDRDTIIDQRKQKIQHLISKEEEKSSVIASEKIQLANVAITQLERRDKPFVKNDYIFILARLNPNNANIDQLKNMWFSYTNDELRTAIRAIIYNVEIEKEEVPYQIPHQKEMIPIKPAPSTGTRTVVLRSDVKPAQSLMSLIE